MGSKSSLSQQLTDARLMVEGLTSHADAVAKVGIETSRATDIKTLSDALAALDSEQESLKAQLKSKTAELEKKQKALKEVMAETKKLVKIAVPQTDWVAFGITDKK